MHDPGNVGGGLPTGATGVEWCEDDFRKKIGAQAEWHFLKS